MIWLVTFVPHRLANTMLGWVLTRGTSIYYALCMMKRVQLFVLPLLLFLLTLSYSFAQEATPSLRREALRELRTEKKATQEAMREKRVNVGETVKEKRGEMRRKFKAERDAFKKRLKNLKDEKRKAVLLRIDEKIATSNAKHTDRMAEVLEKLEGILGRIGERANTLKASGVDTSSLDTAIEGAKEALAKASSAVSTQAGKDYVVKVGIEKTLRANVGEVMSRFRLDLRDTHKLVVDAKQAVMRAAMELAKLKGRGE